MPPPRKEPPVSQEQDRAEVVCLTCKLSKRQCDKRLPICSRCRKLNRECEYRTASRPWPVTQPTQSGSSVKIGISACLRCKLNKRRCDRMTPRCSRCSRLGTNCNYSALPSPDTPLDTDDVFQNEMGLGLAALAQTNIRLDFEPPMKCHSYTPGLINFFLTAIALPSDTTEAYSLSHHLRSQWMQHTTTDPCLFHATLFSASASIDMLQGDQTSARTLYHQTWTMRLINERLARPEPVLTYGTLGAVIPLLYYDMVALDRDSAVAHQKGLVKMLLATPETFRADIEPLIAIVKIAMLSFACIYEVPPIWNCLLSESVRPNTILRNLVSKAIFGQNSLSLTNETIDGILDVYEALSRFDHLTCAEPLSIPVEVGGALTLAKTTELIDRVNSAHSPSTPERLNFCCQISGVLFWEILRGPSHHQTRVPHQTGAQAKQLFKCISEIEPLYWIRNAPEVFTWTVFTGAAASEDRKLCAAFMSKAGAILTAIDDEKLTLLRQGWRYFSLLKENGRALRSRVI